MRLFNTVGLDDKLMKTLTEDEASWVYNGLDCCVTFEVFERLSEEIAANTVNNEPGPVQRTYEKALAKQAPILEMSLRGLRMDNKAKDQAIKEISERITFLESRFAQLTEIISGGPINWRSPLQVKQLFYSCMGIKEIKKRNAQGIFAATVNEEALNKLCLHFWAQPVAKLLLALRDNGKKLGFLQTEVDPDGRMRSSLNIAGTNTGRLSSSKGDFGAGTNLQNVDKALRYPFIADPGMILVNVDLEQADAYNVGAIIYETFYSSHGATAAGAFLDACESGDLHTAVCRMAWDDLGWPDERSAWRAIADQVAYRGLSYRDMAKKLGHGTNYYGQPATMARHTHTEVKIIQSFQNRYFKAFPLIPEWHRWTINEIKTSGVLTTLYGRRRHFFGRGNDPSTWRKAIAFCPQSMTGHQIDMGLLNVWRKMSVVQLLMQVHDSILLQIPFRQLDELMPQIMENLRYEITLQGGRQFFVPLEAKVGWNWGDVEYHKDTKKPIGNLWGIQKYKGHEDRQPPASMRLEDYLNGRLDRRLR